VAKQQPERRFTLLYDKVCRRDILQEARQRVKTNKGAAGVDQVDIDAIRDYGEDRFLNELEQELRSRQYRTALLRRVHTMFGWSVMRTTVRHERKGPRRAQCV
jgi:retron-type reverse transcriptase